GLQRFLAFRGREPTQRYPAAELRLWPGGCAPPAAARARWIRRVHPLDDRLGPVAPDDPRRLVGGLRRRAARPLPAPADEPDRPTSRPVTGQADDAREGAGEPGAAGGGAARARRVAAFVPSRSVPARPADGRGGRRSGDDSTRALVASRAGPAPAASARAGRHRGGAACREARPPPPRSELVDGRRRYARIANGGSTAP